MYRYVEHTTNVAQNIFNWEFVLRLNTSGQFTESFDNFSKYKIYKIPSYNLFHYRGLTLCVSFVDNIRWSEVVNKITYSEDSRYNVSNYSSIFK